MNDKYNTVQNLIDILYVFFEYNEMKKKRESTDDEMFWIGYNIYMVINYRNFLYKKVPKKVTYIFDIDLHDTPDPYLYSILFKDQTIIKKLQEKIPEFLKSYKVYLDVDIFKTIRQDLIYFYNNYNAIKERDDLQFQHITDGYDFLVTSTLPDDTNTTFIEFLKGKEQSSKLRKSRSSRRSKGPWRSVSSKVSKKSKKKKSTLMSKFNTFMRKTLKN